MVPLLALMDGWTAAATWWRRKRNRGRPESDGEHLLPSALRTARRPCGYWFVITGPVELSGVFQPVSRMDWTLIMAWVAVSFLFDPARSHPFISLTNPLMIFCIKFYIN
jgi:hypothetical protein